MSKSRPPPLQIPHPESNSGNETSAMLSRQTFHSSSLRVCRTPTPRVTPPLTPIVRAKTTSVSGHQSAAPSSLIGTGSLLTPPSDGVNTMPPSPLVLSSENADQVLRTKVRISNGKWAPNHCRFVCAWCSSWLLFAITKHLFGEMWYSSFLSLGIMKSSGERP